MNNQGSRFNFPLYTDPQAMRALEGKERQQEFEGRYKLAYPEIFEMRNLADQASRLISSGQDYSDVLDKLSAIKGSEDYLIPLEIQAAKKRGEIVNLDYLMRMKDKYKDNKQLQSMIKMYQMMPK